MNNMPVFSRIYRKIYAVFIVLLVFTAAAVCQETSANSPIDTEKKEWYTNFFVSGDMQTFIAVPALKDFVLPKPGYRISAGYTFLHEKKHSIPLFIETGHSTIAGTNPLVRTIDLFPLTLTLSYDYSPITYFSFGVFAGAGVYFSQIHRYPVVLDILTNNLTKTHNSMGGFTGGISFALNLIEKNIECRAAFSCDVLPEKKRTIPIPSFKLGIRIYPAGMYAYARKRKEPVVIIKEAEPAIVLPPKEEPLPQFRSIYVYFEPESTALDVNAKAEIKKAAAILAENPDVLILFEGSTAPFGTEGERIQVENERILKTAEYLQKNCGVEPDRIIYTEPFKNRQVQQEETVQEEHYTQFRYVQLRFVRLQCNPDSGDNVYKTTQGEK